MNTREEKRGDPKATAEAERPRQALDAAREEGRAVEGEPCPSFTGRTGTDGRTSSASTLTGVAAGLVKGEQRETYAPLQSESLVNRGLPCLVTSAPLVEKTGVATTPELPAQGEAKHAGKEGAAPTNAARVSVPSDERREGPALLAVHLERIFIDPLTRKPLTLEQLRRALCGDGE